MKNKLAALYEPFKKWLDNGPIWVFSDPHFNDEDCKIMDPDWIDPEEQVKRINTKVGKKDTLIILGDIGDLEYAKKLKGYKVLITGNHDRGASYYKDVFNEVYTGPLFIHPNIVLSHEPIELSFGYNIHGHRHGKTRFIYRANTNVMINVAADVIDYTPVRLDKVIQEFKVTDIHRVAIEKQKERK